MMIRSQNLFHFLCLRDTYKHCICFINDYKHLPENEIDEKNFKIKSTLTKTTKKLSLVAQNLLNKDINYKIISQSQIYPNEDYKNGIDEIADLFETKIKIPKVSIGTFYNEEILNLTPTTVELPRTGKISFELFGKPDPSQPISKILCPGCGSFLHCKDVGISGYLPSEKYLNLTKHELKITFCQRCLLLKEKNIALDVTVNKYEYHNVIREIKKHPALIILLVDVFDLPNSFYSRISELIHHDRPIYIIGNKVDLIPSDGKGYIKSIKDALIKLCIENGFCMKNHIRYIGLISAKTGFGIEHLITKLLKEWKLKGHVYILGCANSGKSTLFNALISSDFCRSSAREILLRATTSNWPGTTLNLLKFPILNPKPEYMIKRYNRLKIENEQNEEHRLHSKRYSQSKNPSLIDHIGLSISTPTERAIKEKIGADSSFVIPSYTFSPISNDLKQNTGHEGAIKYLEAKPFRYDDSKFKYWCFDTPGLINDNQIINLLNQEELAKVLPSKPIMPRTFVVKPGQVVFLSGLSRIDYLQGDVSIYFTIFASQELPVRIVNLQEADNFWKTNLGTKEFSVPMGNSERLLSLPSLIGTEMILDGVGWDESTADIVLSSLGWAAITAGLGRKVTLRAYTIGGRGCKLRQPALLPRAINLRGKRIKDTPCYEHVKNKKNYD